MHGFELDFLDAIALGQDDCWRWNRIRRRCTRSWKAILHQETKTARRS